MIDVAVDGVHEFHDVAKNTASKTVSSKIPKEALHHVEPGSAGGREVHMKTGMTLQPALNGRMFMSGIVVHDQMELFVCRCGIVYQSEETTPFLMPVTLLAQADDFSVKRIESCEQSRGAIALVIVRHGSSTTAF